MTDGSKVSTARDHLVHRCEGLRVAAVERHDPQVKAGLLGVLRRVGVVGGVFVAEEVAGRLGPRPAGVMGDQGAVDAAAEQGGEGQVRRDAALDRRRQDRVQRPGVALRQERSGGLGQGGERLAVATGEHIARRQQQHLAGLARRQQGADLRAEQEAVAVLDQVEGLLAERVARRHELAGAQVHGHEGEHAAEPPEGAAAPDGQRIRQHLGVGRGPETHAERRKLEAQRRMIVDLAVERHQDAAVGRELRLHPVLGVDDAQAAGAEGDGGGDGDHRIGHVAAMQDAADQTGDDPLGVRPVHGHRNSAHPRRSCPLRILNDWTIMVNGLLINAR